MDPHYDLQVVPFFSSVDHRGKFSVKSVIPLPDQNQRLFGLQPFAFFPPHFGVFLRIGPVVAVCDPEAKFSCFVLSRVLPSGLMTEKTPTPSSSRSFCCLNKNEGVGVLCLRPGPGFHRGGQERIRSIYGAFVTFPC